MSHHARHPLALALALVAVIPALAQPAMPGARDPSRVVAGTYKVDTNHTQVLFTVNHMAITPLFGSFAANGGTLTLDPAKPAAAKVTVTFNVPDASTTVVAFTKHLLSDEILDGVKYPTATFTSTSIQANGDRAKIAGTLTFHGVTQPVVLDAQFYGAGVNERSKKLNIGFTATARVKRSAFGITYASGVVSDDVDLQITGAFEKAD